MSRRVILLILIMAVPVLTALGTQQLASTTAVPTLPNDPVSTQIAPASGPEGSATASAEPTADLAQEPAAGTGGVVVGEPEDADSEEEADDELEEAAEEDGPDEVDLDTDSDGEQDDAPESGTVAR